MIFLLQTTVYSFELGHALVSLEIVASLISQQWTICPCKYPWCWSLQTRLHYMLTTNILLDYHVMPWTFAHQLLIIIQKNMRMVYLQILVSRELSIYVGSVFWVYSLGLCDQIDGMHALVPQRTNLDWTYVCQWWFYSYNIKI